MARSRSRTAAKDSPDRRHRRDLREIRFIRALALPSGAGGFGAPVIVDLGLFVASEDSEEGLFVGQMMLVGAALAGSGARES